MEINWTIIWIIVAFVLAWFCAWAIVKIIKGFSTQIKIIGKVMRILIEIGLVVYVVMDIWL